jgi:hypothetical protein
MTIYAPQRETQSKKSFSALAFSAFAFLKKKRPQPGNPREGFIPDLTFIKLFGTFCRHQLVATRSHFLQAAHP